MWEWSGCGNYHGAAKDYQINKLFHSLAGKATGYGLHGHLR